MTHFPIVISACCVSLYWITVVVKSFRLARKIGKDPNVVPRERIGQLTRLIWVPTIIVWILLLWQGAFASTAILITLPLFIKFLATIMVILATALTFWCWRQMGRSWRIGIDPREKTQLIITGPYHYVLHPIYSLSMVLSLATLCVLPSFAMLIIIATHILMLNIESRREESHLLRIHGQTYRAYQQRVGRFIPLFSHYKK